jgi:hypothetical protein
LAYRSEKTSWVSNIDAWLSNWLGYNRTRPYHNAVTNRYWHNGRVCTNANVVSNPGATPKITVPARRTSDCKRVVDKHCAVRNKTIIADANKFADESMRLNFAAFTYDHTTLNLDEGSDEAAIADGAIVNINWLDNSDVRAELNIPNPSQPQGGISHRRQRASPFKLTERARSNTETTLRA